MRGGEGGTFINLEWLSFATSKSEGELVGGGRWGALRSRAQSKPLTTSRTGGIRQLWRSVLENCSSFLYLGANSDDLAALLAERRAAGLTFFPGLRGLVKNFKYGSKEGVNAVLEVLLETLTEQPVAVSIAAAVRRRLDKGVVGAPRTRTLVHSCDLLSLLAREDALPLLEELTVMLKGGTELSRYEDGLSRGAIGTSGGLRKLLRVGMDTRGGEGEALSRAIEASTSLFRHLTTLHMAPLRISSYGQPLPLPRRDDGRFREVGSALVACCPDLNELILWDGRRTLVRGGVLRDASLAAFLEGASAAGGVARLERFVLRSSLVTDEGMRKLVQTMASHEDGLFARLRGFGLHLGETVLMRSAGPVDKRNDERERAWTRALLEGAQAAADGHGHDWASSIMDLCTRQVYTVQGIFNNPSLFPQLRRLDVVGKEDSHQL